MTEVRSCEVCGSAVHARLYELRGIPVVQCGTCGLVFVGKSLKPEELIALYDESYYEDSDQPGYAGYGEAEGRKRHHDRSLLKELEAIVPPGDILELGCAYGYFLDEARRRGWRVRGVEPSTHAARHASEVLGLEVSTASFTDLPVEPESLDVIALWDVIEHLPNPRQTVEHALVWLRPGGVLALSTGDVGSLSARLHGPDWSLMTPPWHQFFFSRRTLRYLLEGAGFTVVKFGGDGSVAVDPGSIRPRVPAPLAALLRHPWVTTAARRLGAGGIMFAFARKAPP